MEIRIDTATITAHETGALAKLLIETVCSASDALREACETGRFSCDPIEIERRAIDAIGDMTVSTLIKGVVFHSRNFTVSELTRLIADLNAELYSRREIKPEDNPASGVAAAALNSDADLPRDSFAAKETVIRPGDDLAKVFGNTVIKPLVKEMVEGMDGTLDFASIFATSNAVTDALIPEISKELAERDATAAAQLDKNGLPWDSRIHAASKAINADGTWRQKRGVAADLVTTIEAQLRQAMSVPGPQVTAPSMSREQETANLASHDLYTDQDEWKPDVICDGNGQVVLGLCKTCGRGEAELIEPCVVPQAAPTIPPPPPESSASLTPPGGVLPPPPPVTAPPPGADPTTFPELVTFIAAQKVAGKLNQTQVQAALTAIGIEGALPVINSRLDLLPALVAKLRQIGGV